MTTIDTSDSYSRGRSEEIIGQALRGRRYEAEILTKVRSQMGDGPHDVGLSRKHIIAACEDSLRRLQTDYIDLYQMHSWDAEAPLEESLRALDELVRDGKVRYVGCSNFAAWQLTWALWLADRRGFAPLVSVQPHYNLFERSVEAELAAGMRRLRHRRDPLFPARKRPADREVSCRRADPRGHALSRQRALAATTDRRTSGARWRS